MKLFIPILFLISIILCGCASTAPTKKTTVYTIEPINDKGSVVVEVNGNVTRIYSNKSLKEK